jgi:hypothetical protein
VRTPSLTKHLAASAVVSTLTLFALGAANVAHAGLSDFIFQLGNRGGTTIINTVTDDSGQKSSIKIRISGNVTFTDAEDDVLTLTRRAQFIQEVNGTSRRLDFRLESGGKVVRTYRVNGKIVPYDAAAQKWFAGWVPSLLRESAIDVDQRIVRIAKNGGKTAVLDEMDRIKSDYARAQYVGAFAKAGMLDEASMPRVISLATKTNSDFERKNMLTAIVEKQTLSAAQQVQLLTAVAKMNSAFEQKNVLVALSPQLASDVAVSGAWRDAVRKMDSDFERKGVVESLAARKALSPQQVEMALETLSVMTSDFERGHALRSLLPHLQKPTPTQLAAFVQAAQGMRSDFELRGVLTAMAERMSPERATYQAMLQVIKQMQSDFEKRNVLETIARRMPRTPELVSSYREVTKGMNDFERDLAERALNGARS